MKDRIKSYLLENIPIKYENKITMVQVWSKEKKEMIKIPRQSKSITTTELRKRMDTINLLVKLILN